MDLPDGPFGCILADPPWRFVTFSGKGRDRCPDGLDPKAARNLQRQNNPERHYKTMDLDDIKAMPVGDLTAKNCVLFMWAVDPMIPEALEVGKAWGFKFKTVGFVWAKERRETSSRGSSFENPDDARFPMGTGYWTRANPELCLLFTRGKPIRRSASVRKLLIAARREHSRKPDEQYDRIARLVDGPYLELFARRQRKNWRQWGNEVGKLDGIEGDLFGGELGE